VRTLDTNSDRVKFSRYRNGGEDMKRRIGRESFLFSQKGNENFLLKWWTKVKTHVREESLGAYCRCRFTKE